jgi:hypothetical protein
MGLQLKAGEECIERPSEAILDHFADQGAIDRRHLVIGLGQLAAGGFGQNIHLQAELLGHLQRRALEQAQSLEEGSGALPGSRGFGLLFFWFG